MKKYIFSISSLKQGRIFPVHVLEVEENISEEYQNENFLITELENFNFQQLYYDETENKVKEKTKFQLYKENLYKLKIGEFFNKDTQEFMMIERPSKYHKWNGKTWEVDIKEVKDIVNEKWKVERQLKIDKDTNYKGFIFQTREYTDIHNFEQYGFLMMLGKAKQSDKVEWRMKDNSYHEFTVQELLEVVAIWGARKKAIFEDNKRMWLELEKAETVEEIEKIKWGV
ncbi:DUF4376 domain-containing protein [Fusobacterium necrophorum]|uniref:DUF4376 domain-containing protein n=1 Tax=Fusobacterium necrophorum TaxID=859 RepID=UPI00370F72F6